MSENNKIYLSQSSLPKDIFDSFAFMKNKAIILILATIVLSSCLSTRNSSREFTFIQVTDPQFGMTSGNKGFTEEIVLYEKAVGIINQLKPAFVVITGDLVNDMANKPQWDEFRRITAMIATEIKVYYSPGNHDIGQDPKKEDLDNFNIMFGSDRFSFTYDKCSFIGFNSCLVKSNTPVHEDEQFAWLGKELEKGKNARLTMLFTHYPFFTRDPSEAEAYFNIKPDTRRKYLSLFSDHQADAVFSGHLHNNAGGKYENTEYITTSAVGKPLGKFKSGMRVVEVSGKEYRHYFLPLDSVINIR